MSPLFPSLMIKSYNHFVVLFLSFSFSFPLGRWKKKDDKKNLDYYASLRPSLLLHSSGKVVFVSKQVFNFYEFIYFYIIFNFYYRYYVFLIMWVKEWNYQMKVCNMWSVVYVIIVIMWKWLTRMHISPLLEMRKEYHKELVLDNFILHIKRHTLFCHNINNHKCILCGAISGVFVLFLFFL